MQGYPEKKQKTKKKIFIKNSKIFIYSTLLKQLIHMIIIQFLLITITQQRWHIIVQFLLEQ